MSEDRKPFLLLGLGLAGVAGWQLLQKPASAPAPGITCPTGYHEAGGVCVADPVTPPAADNRPKVTATAGLLVRSGPHLIYPVVGSLSYGQPLDIACQCYGSPVAGSQIWDHIAPTAGAPSGGYVSDWWVSTPGVGTFSAGYNYCPGVSTVPEQGSGSGSTGVKPGGLPPTGKAALSQIGQIVARMIVSTGCSWSDADYVVLARKTTATATRPFGRVWIKDKYTWDGLAAPRSAINVITPALLYQLQDAGSLRRAIIRNFGEAWIWDAGANGNLWDTAMDSFNLNRGPFSVLKSAAGWC